jgi:hypothetical protein
MGKILEHGDRAAGNGHGSGVASGGRGGSEVTNYVFSPGQLVSAVTFHLLDEGIARRVCPKSVERVLKRLVRAARPVQISASLWRAMGNRQRMEWLLVSSRTDYRVRGGEGGMAVLV